MKKIDYNRITSWNGGGEDGLAEYLVWIFESSENYEKAKKEILEYSMEESEYDK